MTAPAETCGTCTRPVDTVKWADKGYECSHVECPHRARITAAPPARDWLEQPDGIVRPKPPHE